MARFTSPAQKRWKLALLGSIFNICMAAALFIIGQYQYLPIPIGSLGLIITAFIGGDSFRPSIYDTSFRSNISNKHEIMGE